MTIESAKKLYSEPTRVQDGGFVRLVDLMGDETSIVEAARVSYGSGTTKKRSDTGLIRYLLRSGHGTPFEMCVIKLHLRVPMHVWRQMVRHRMSSVNEYSTRYSEAIAQMESVAPEAWRLQGGRNKQGSSGYLINKDEEKALELTQKEWEFQQHARTLYEERLDCGVAREQARKDLPLSTFTEVYWLMNVRSLFNYLKLRLDEHAQLEHRRYAQVIEEILEEWMPDVYEAFSDYVLGAVTLSQVDMRILNYLDGPRSDPGILTGLGLTPKSGEFRELVEKLRTLRLFRQLKDLEDEFAETE